jgi:pimeloyl-ACP methyl ester carboxylesterase
VYRAWLVLLLRACIRILTFASPVAAGHVALRLFTTPRRHHRPAWEREIAGTGERLTLGPGLAALAWGSGPVVLLLHGWEGRGTQLGRFVAPLAASGFRVLAVDAPAHGESPGTETDLIECTEALRRIGRDIGPLAGIVAHSFGGATTTLAVERGLDVRAVVLIASPTSVRDVIARFAVLIGLRDLGLVAFRTALERRTGVRLSDVGIYERASDLQVPALIIHDHDDAEVPFEDGERLTARWPGARSYPTQGLGHRRILKDDDVIRRAVEFVGNVARSARP